MIRVDDFELSVKTVEVLLYYNFIIMLTDKNGVPFFRVRSFVLFCTLRSCLGE